MSIFTLCYDNRADAATLSAGNWNAALPLGNLKDYRTAMKARSTDAAALSTLLRFVLPETTRIGCVALAKTNASVWCAYRLRLFDDAGFVSVSYDSGVVSVYPAGSVPYGDAEWGSASWWTAAPAPAEIARSQNNITHVLSRTTYSRYGELQILDTANPTGYFEAGRLFVGNTWQPARGAAYGELSMRLTSRSDVARAIDGTSYFARQAQDFSIPVGFPRLTMAEAMRALDLQAIVDVTGEVIAICDPGDIAYAHRRQVLGRLKELDPIEYPLFATYATKFQVEGTL